MASCMKRTSAQTCVGSIATRCASQAGDEAAGIARRPCTHQQVHVVFDKLRERSIDGHRRRVLEARLAHVGDDADDLAPHALDRAGRAATRPRRSLLGEADAAAQRTHAREVSAREALADEGHRRGPGAVPIAERASLQDPEYRSWRSSRR